MVLTKNRLPATIAGLFISGLHLLFTTTNALAGSFSLSPMVTISDAHSGQAKGSINVSNNGKEPLRMRVYAEDFSYNRTKGYSDISSHGNSAIPYLQFSPRELTVPPGVTRNVRVGIALPASAPDGEYRAAIFVEELREQEVKTDAPKKNRVVMLAQVASLFFISKGGVKANLQANTAVWNNQQKTLNIVLTNQGKKSAYPNVNWKISQNGKEVNNGNISGAIVQAEKDREVTLRLKDKDLTLAAGSYQLSGEIVNGDQKPTPFSFGVVIP